jgi:glycosyltransferase involved in cell wall biosynthesis
VPRELPSFDLVVATTGRSRQLAQLLESLRAQTHRPFRVLVVDQSSDDRLETLLSSAHDLDVVHLRSGRGLSRARNAALAQLTADVVAFPDDDCRYPPDLLARVAERLAEPSLQGVAGRVADARGRSSDSWKGDRALLDRSNLWNRANSATVFLRRELVERVGAFDEELGLGSGRPWHSGEEIDYLLRALDAGARVEYEPSLVVEHRLVPDDASLGLRDGATVGYLLRKHGYPRRERARMLVRPLGGAIVSLGRADLKRARYHAATLRGRIRGLRAT